MSTNTDIIRRAYDAFSRGDIPAVLAEFDDTIEWYAPDELPDGGTYRGPSQVARFFGSLPEHYDELRVDVDRVLDAGDQVIAEGHHRGHIGGREFDVGLPTSGPCRRQGDPVPRIQRQRQTPAALRRRRCRLTRPAARRPGRGHGPVSLAD